MENILLKAIMQKECSLLIATFISNTKNYVGLILPQNTEEKYQLNNCSFTINNTNLPTGDFVGIIRGAALKNCTFTLADPDAKKKRYYWWIWLPKFEAKQKHYNFGDTNPATNPGSSGTKILYEGK